MMTLKRAVLALGLFAGMSQRATGIDIREPRALMMISEYGETRNAVLDMSKLSEVRKIMLVDALRDMLADNSKLRLEGYVFRAGEPDLRVVAGRAEWFIDQVVLLPREAENSVRKMNERIEMWKASAASRRTETPGAGWNVENEIRRENTHWHCRWKGNGGVHPKPREVSR
jgi:hypothetical protein